VLGRRLLALLVAVLCIVVRFGVEAEGPNADEAKALVGPGLVCRISADAGAEPEGPDAPEGLDEPLRTPGSLARVALHDPWRAFRGRTAACERRGDPKASRGPPSLVVA
jgi:hypothetical protein